MDEYIISEVDLETIKDDLGRLLDDLYFLEHPKGVELSDRVGRIIDDLAGSIYRLKK